MNGRLDYCSGKAQGSSAREVDRVISEEIEKDTITDYLIYAETLTYMRPFFKWKHLFIRWQPTIYILNIPQYNSEDKNN
jgi:hypothetical protein